MDRRLSKRLLIDAPKPAAQRTSCLHSTVSWFSEFLHVVGVDVLTRFKRVSVVVGVFLVTIINSYFILSDLSSNNWRPNFNYLIHLISSIIFYIALSFYVVLGKPDWAFSVFVVVSLLNGSAAMMGIFVTGGFSVGYDLGPLAYIGIACFGSLFALSWPFQVFFYSLFTVTTLAIFIRESIEPTTEFLAVREGFTRIFGIFSEVLPAALPLVVSTFVLAFYLRLKDFSELLLAKAVRSIAQMNWDTSPVVVGLRKREERDGYDSLMDLEKSLLMIVRNLTYMRSYMDPSLIHALERVIQEEKEKEETGKQELLQPIVSDEENEADIEMSGEDSPKSLPSVGHMSTSESLIAPPGMYLVSHAMAIGGVNRKRFVVLDVHVPEIHWFCLKHKPLKVSRLFELIVSVVVGAVEFRHGTIHSFVSDRLLASFDSIRDCQDAALEAVECAWSIQQSLSSDRSFPHELHLRISVVSGDLMFGQLGNRELRRFSLLGPEVRLAESINHLVEWDEISVPFSENNRMSVVVDQSVLGSISRKFAARPVEIFAAKPASLRGRETPSVGWVKTFHCLLQRKQKLSHMDDLEWIRRRETQTDDLLDRHFTRNFDDDSSSLPSHARLQVEGEGDGELVRVFEVVEYVENPEDEGVVEEVVEVADVSPLAKRFVAILQDPSLKTEQDLVPARKIIRRFLSLEKSWPEDVREVFLGHLTGTGLLNDDHLLASFAKEFVKRGRKLTSSRF